MPDGNIETYATNDSTRVTVPESPRDEDEGLADFRLLWAGYALAPDDTLDPTALKLKKALREVVGIDELVAALEAVLEQLVRDDSVRGQAAVRRHGPIQQARTVLLKVKGQANG